MRISGFSFSRNAEKLYYPVAESIRSILPICDEFVVAVGRGDPDDRTREAILAIGDPKIRVVDTEWTDRERLRGWVHSQQTNIALSRCSGDWCFYLQADEVIHERDLPAIRGRCAELLGDRSVEGLLFRYRHFWGDYAHCHLSHAWYPEEIRIIRNGAGIESWRSAQSFRRGGRKLRVCRVDAEVYHYGWVRPPRLMQGKNREFSATHLGREAAAARFAGAGAAYDYGSLERIPRYDGTHPAVMRERIAAFDWGRELQYTGKSRTRQRHERLKYRMLTFIEQKLLRGRLRLGAKAYKLLRL
jgi:hypothetical protein